MFEHAEETMKLIPMEHKHFERLWQITALCEPWWGWDRNTSDRLYAQREGFVVVNKSEEVIGHITFSDYHAQLDVTIHNSVLPEYHSRWLTKSIYKQVFDYVFCYLECRRAGGIAFEGLTDLTYHERLGFKKEGIIRDGLHIRGEYYNIHLFGMLPDERLY